jgi:hypothetical protein
MSIKIIDYKIQLKIIHKGDHMSLIKKPLPINYISLKSKPKLPENIYNELVDYVSWSDGIDLENDLDLVIETAIKNMFATDKNWSKFKKLNGKNNSNKFKETINESSNINQIYDEHTIV